MTIVQKIKKAARNAIRLLGIDVKFYVPREREYRDMEPVFFTLYDQCKPYTMTSIERMYALFKAVEYLVKNRIPGDIVECGVWRGGSCMMIIKALQHFGDTSRTIQLFDTFQGMAKPNEQDVAHDGQRLNIQWNNMAADTHNEWDYASLEEVKHNLSSTNYPSDQIRYTVGKVEETIPGVLPSEIALLRLDTDWYASTKHEMTHLFPKLVSRGILIVDDYGHWKGSRAAVDEAFAAAGVSPYLARVDYTGRLFIKP